MVRIFGTQRAASGGAGRLARALAVAATLVAAVGFGGRAEAASVTVNPDPSKYLGYMNVFELPANGGGYVFGSGWGTQDLRSEFTATTLTLKANNIGDPNPFWYQGGGAPGHPGNKTMDASLYIQDDTLAGDTVTFSGTVLSNTLVSPYTSQAFIKHFDGAFNLLSSQTVPLTPGEFSISLATLPETHVQYGFETIGPNAWGTDADLMGSVTIALAVTPEPASLAAVAVVGVAMVRRRRA